MKKQEKLNISSVGCLSRQTYFWNHRAMTPPIRFQLYFVSPLLPSMAPKFKTSRGLLMSWLKHHGHANILKWRSLSRSIISVHVIYQ